MGTIIVEHKYINNKYDIQDFETNLYGLLIEI